ncbi:MAG: TrkH family potassium uptake protein [Alphaproteobacteria bacterium]
MIGILYILSQALGVAAFALLAPAIVAVATGDPGGEGFLIVAGLVGFLAGAIFFSLRGRHRVLDRTAGIASIALAWTLLPLIGAVPIAWATPLGALEALFEATSGLTTTGATAFTSLSDIGPAVIFWRSELQWLGGFLTLITFAAISAPIGVGGLSALGIAAIGRNEGGLGRIYYLLRGVGTLYLLGTGICIIVLYLSGVPAFDAFCIALSTVSTGGFMPHDGDLSVYHSPLATTAVAVFMIIGATSITWHRAVVELRHGALTRHLESYAVIWMIIIVGAAFTAIFLASGDLPTALGEGLFSAASLITTTGFEVRTGTLTALPGAIAMLLALAGGAALSTAGGLKLYRIGAMSLGSMRELHRLVFPSSVRGIGLAGMTRNPGLMKAIWANLALSVFLVIVAATLLSIQLPSIEAAMTAAISGFANIGPLYAASADQALWPAYADFDGFSKSVMIAIMILGRIEIFTFLAIISLADRRF